MDASLHKIGNRNQHILLSVWERNRQNLGINQNTKKRKMIDTSSVENKRMKVEQTKIFLSLK